MACLKLIRNTTINRQQKGACCLGFLLGSSQRRLGHLERPPKLSHHLPWVTVWRRRLWHQPRGRQTGLSVRTRSGMQDCTQGNQPMTVGGPLPGWGWRTDVCHAPSRKGGGGEGKLEQRKEQGNNEMVRGDAQPGAAIYRTRRMKVWHDGMHHPGRYGSSGSWWPRRRRDSLTSPLRL